MATEYVPLSVLAEKLHLAEVTLRGWVKEGKIPATTYIKVGSTYRFDIEAVVQSLRGDTNETTENLVGE